MHRRKAALTMIFQSLFCACACGIQFWIYGYSLYQSHTTNPMLGDASLAGLHNVLAAPSLANSDIPDILYACFGFTFVTATAMILAGAMLERGRLFPSMLFLLCWTTFVYYILAYFEWNPSGWLYQLGVLDFAGSGPVHIASGFSALAWSLMLGPRLSEHDSATRQKIIHHKPHNPFLVGIGTCFIWFGWFAFNGRFIAMSRNEKLVLMIFVLQVPARQIFRSAQSTLWSTRILPLAEVALAGLCLNTSTPKNSASSDFALGSFRVWLALLQPLVLVS